MDRGIHINDDLQGDWEIYGAQAFEFTVLEEIIGLEALQNAEARHLATVDNPYNIAQVPGMTERQHRLISKQPPTPRQFFEMLHDDPLPEWTVVTAISGIEESTVGGLIYRLLDARVGFTLEDFFEYQDHGYRGLYGGETARDIAARKGLKRGQSILDWMGPDELTANLFRASQTEQKLRREPIQGKAQANRTHFEVGRAVRAFILEQGNMPPEQLPTPDVSIQELRRREQKRIEAEHQPSLFPPDEDER